MMLDKLPVSGRPTNLENSRALAVGVGGGCLDVFSLTYHLSAFGCGQYKQPGEGWAPSG